MTLSPETIDPFLNWLSANGASPETLRGYRSDLTAFTLWVNLDRFETLAEQENAAALWLTMAREHKKPKTIRRRLTSLRSWSKYCDEPTFLSHYRPPIPEQSKAKPLPGGIPSVLAMVEEARRGPDAPGRMALVGLCGLVGLRVSAACTVTALDVDTSPLRRSVSFVGKGARSFTMPVSDPAWEAIGPAVTTGGRTSLVGVGERRARQIVTLLGERAGLGHIASHDLRRTYATALWDRCHDLRVVQELLGHASPVTTAIYIGITDAAMRDAAAVA